MNTERDARTTSDEFERLASLYRKGDLTSKEFEEAKKRLLIAPGFAVGGIRRRASTEIFGLPLWSVAIGPDFERNETRGHARGIIAFGDIATGVLACGGFARGVVAIGGLSIGLFGLGGLAIGVGLAVGGGAIGGVALGGAALGYVAVGGAAAGYYALGGAAAGAHTISAFGQDPAATEFFARYCPWLTNRLSP